MRTVRRVRDRVRLHSEEQEIVLHEEVPVVEMRVRPGERVRIVKETRLGEAPVVE